MKQQTTFDFSHPSILKNIIARVVEIADPDKIILFGSRATGKARKDSDYDLCILKSRLKNKRKFAYKIRSNIDLMVPVDIIAITPSEFNKSKSKWYYVYHDIEKEGKVVYEK